MPGPSEVGRPTFRVDQRGDRRGPLLRRDAGLVRLMIDGDREGRTERGGVRLDHHAELEPFADVGENRHADLAAAVGDHEVDRRRSGSFGDADEVPFVLAVLGIDDDDDLAPGDRFDGRFDRRKLLRHKAHGGRRTNDTCWIASTNRSTRDSAGRRDA